MAIGSLGSGAREYVLKIVADVQNAIDGISEVAKSTGSFKDKAVGMGKSILSAIPTDKILAFGEASIQVAAEADDAMDAVNAAFGNSAGEIEKFSKGAANNMGISAAQFQMLAAKTGALLQSVGINSHDAAKQTEVLAQRGADMATIWGTSTEEAMGAINMALKGATKGLTKFGVILSKNEIDARAMKEGYVDASGKVTAAGRAIAAQELILEKTSNVQGEFATQSGDLGNQQAILKAKMEDLQAEIGTALLPMILKIFEVVQPFIDFLSAHADIFVPIIAGIMALVGALKAWQIAQALLNTTLLTNPIFLIAAAIAALVAGIIWAYNNVQWFRDAVDAMGRALVAAFNWILDTAKTVFGWIKDNWPLLVAIITGPFGTAVYLVVKYWDQIKGAAIAVYNWIKDNWPLLLAILTGPFGLAVLAIQRNWDAIKDGARAAFDWVINLFGGLGDRIGGALGGMANGIKTVFVTAFNAIKWAWNNTLGGFSFKIPDIFGIPGRGQTVTFPKMATGGIVSRPMLALVGDVPEAIVPLSRAAEFGMTGGGTNITLNVYALTATSEVGRMVYNALRDYERTSGTALFNTAFEMPRF